MSSHVYERQVSQRDMYSNHDLKIKAVSSIRVPDWYPTETVILPGSIFRFQLPVNDFLNYLRFFVNKLCVGNGDAPSRF